METTTTASLPPYLPLGPPFGQCSHKSMSGNLEPQFEAQKEASRQSTDSAKYEHFVESYRAFLFTSEIESSVTRTARARGSGGLCEFQR